MDDPPRDVVIERLETLERANRRLWRFGVGTVVAAIVLLAEGTSLIRPPGIIEAQGFLLKDKSGKVRARLEAAFDGTPQFSLLDDEGTERVTLQTTLDNSASLLFFDRGQARIQLT